MDDWLAIPQLENLPTGLQHHKQMFETLWKMRTNGELCDIQFNVQGICILAHKVIVSACSPHLQTYLKHSQEEEDNLLRPHEIQIESYSVSVFFEMIRYMYTGEYLTLSDCAQSDFVKLLKEWNVMTLVADSEQKNDRTTRESLCDGMDTDISDTSEQRIETFHFSDSIEHSKKDVKSEGESQTKEDELLRNEFVLKNDGEGKNMENESLCEKSPPREQTRRKRGKPRKHSTPQRYLPKDKHVKAEPGARTKDPQEQKRVARPRKNTLSLKVSQSLRRKSARTRKKKESQPKKKMKVGGEEKRDKSDLPSLRTLRGEVKEQTEMSEEQDKMSGKKKAYCKHCDKYLTQQHYLPFHMWKFHYTEGMPEPKLFICEYPGCNQAFRGQVYLKEHADNVHSTERSVCCVCGKTFKNEKGMKHHMKAQHSLPVPIKPRKPKSDASFKCEEPECGKSFSVKASYEAHMDRHRGIKLICELCGYSCGYKESMRSHKYKIHNIEPPEGLLYECKFCDHKTCFISGMKSHERRHSSDKPFQCEKCAKCFKSNMELINHNRIIHDRTSYDCTYCSRKFSVKNNLKLHVRNQHEQKHVKAFACEICGYRSNLKGNLNHHLRNVHKIQVQTKYKVPEIQNKSTSTTNISSNETTNTDIIDDNAGHKEIQFSADPVYSGPQASVADVSSFASDNDGRPSIDLHSMERVEIQPKDSINQLNALYHTQDLNTENSPLWASRDSEKVSHLFHGPLGVPLEPNDSHNGLQTHPPNISRNTFPEQPFNYY